MQPPVVDGGNNHCQLPFSHVQEASANYHPVVSLEYDNLNMAEQR
jgi:hypothetical protein